MRNTLIAFLLILSASLAPAHVGNPDVYYEGDAGPYHLFVTVRLPKVIPGVAEVEVRSASPDVQRIEVVPLRLSGPGSNLPPVPDVAQRSKNDPQFFVSNLWFMEFGALQVRIDAIGTKGRARLSVPVASFATQSFPMNPWLSKLIASFLIFLTLSIVPIAGGIVRDSTVPEGQLPSRLNRTRSGWIMAVSLCVALGIIGLGWMWWSAEATTYERSVELLKPPRAEAILEQGKRLVIRPSGKLLVPVAGMGNYAREVRMNELLPDHGHLMHLIVLGSPGMGLMWHLHPALIDSTSFGEDLPAMPAGRYELYADIVAKNGFPWTLVGDVQLPEISGAPEAPDDAYWEGSRLTTPVRATSIANLSDGARIVWDRSPLKANQPAGFRFHVEAPDGLPAHDMQPYMGMVAHAEIVSSDRSVFAHIHPAGTVPMASLSLTQTSAVVNASDAPGFPGRDNSMLMPMHMHHEGASLPANFSFAYGFPHPGDYRIFLQIKRAGHVQSAAFDARVD